jgi:Bacterial Ig-like domain (group 3)
VTVNPSVYGQSILFTASVAAVAPGTGAPAGSVTFSNGSTTLGTVALTAGVATYTTTKLATGQHAITAAYGGSATFATSTPPVLAQTVNQDGTSTDVTASANPSVFGQSVIFTATVSAALPGSGTPTGSVTFSEDLRTFIREKDGPLGERRYAEVHRTKQCARIQGCRVGSAESRAS